LISAATEADLAPPRHSPGQVAGCQGQPDGRPSSSPASLCSRGLPVGPMHQGDGVNTALGTTHRVCHSPWHHGHRAPGTMHHTCTAPGTMDIQPLGPHTTDAQPLAPCTMDREPLTPRTVYVQPLAPHSMDKRPLAPLAMDLRHHAAHTMDILPLAPCIMDAQPLAPRTHGCTAPSTTQPWTSSP